MPIPLARGIEEFLGWLELDQHVMFSIGDFAWHGRVSVPEQVGFLACHSRSQGPRPDPNRSPPAETMPIAGPTSGGSCRIVAGRAIRDTPDQALAAPDRALG